MKKKYEARTGAPFKTEQAQQFGERLEYVTNQHNGNLTPEAVVDDGKNVSSPFHTYFEWDDKKASKEFRLQQARNLINHVVEVVVIEGKQSTQRSFFNVTNGGGNKVYVTLNKALTTNKYRTQTLNQLITILENATELIKLFKSYEK